MSAATADTLRIQREAEAASVRPGAYPGYTLRDLLTSIFYHRRAVLIAFFVPVLLGFVAALASSTVYVAQARLLVLLGNDYVFQPTGAAPGSGISLDRDQIVQGELEILQSTTLAIETLRTVGPLRVYPSATLSRPGEMELLGEQLERDLTITAVPESNVIELGFRSHDRIISAEVLRTLIDHYLERRLSVFGRGASSGADDQRALFAKRLSDAEEALASFDEAHGISDFDTQVNLLLQRKSANATDRAANDQQIAELTARLETVRARLPSVPASVQLYADSSRAPSQQGLGDALAKMQADRSTLSARYTDDFPLVRDADQQIAALKAEIAHTPAAAMDGGRNGVNPIWQDLSQQEIADAAQLSGLAARKIQLDQDASEIQRRLDELNGLGREYRDLRRSRDALSVTFDTFVHDTEQSQLSSAIERSQAANVRVIQSPEVPARGTSLRLLIAVASVLLGGVAAVATLTLLTALRQSFVTIRDAEQALNLPVLVAVPRQRPFGEAD